MNNPVRPRTLLNGREYFNTLVFIIVKGANYTSYFSAKMGSNSQASENFVFNENQVKI